MNPSPLVIALFGVCPFWGMPYTPLAQVGAHLRRWEREVQFQEHPVTVSCDRCGDPHPWNADACPHCGWR